jgi:hypothetical protein
VEACGALKQPRTNAILYLRNGVSELLGDGLALEGFDGVAVRRGGHNDECDDGDGRVTEAEDLVKQENGRRSGRTFFAAGS